MSEDIGKWLASVEKARPKQERGKGLTFKELKAKAGGIGDDSLRRKLHQAKALGLLIVGKEDRENITGAVMAVPVYIIKEKK